MPVRSQPPEAPSPLWAHPVSFAHLEYETSQFHLRIEDVLKLEKGDVLHLVCFDRNIGDRVGRDNVQNQVVSSKRLLRKAQRAKYTHDTGLKGFLTFKGIDKKPREFEFDIEHKRNAWYPLEGGKFLGVHYTEMKEDTRIGWRGPMVLGKWISYFPEVYMPQPKEFLDDAVERIKKELN